MAGQPLLPESERRWFHALLVMGTFVVGLILIAQVAQLLVYFSDILFILVMAWVVAFGLSPLVSIILRAFPTLPRGLVAILIYVIIAVVLIALILVAASSLTSSILQFVEELPNLQGRLPEILQPWQNQLSGLGIHVDLVKSAQDLLDGLGSLGGDLVPALTGLALASLGAIGNLMLIVFLSLFILIDKDKMSAFFNRLVPPRYAEEARLFETSVAKSVGGFMRGQAIQGLIYAVFAIVAHLALGLDFMPASAALVFITQTIPFFGPFVSWAPPVVVAALTHSDALVPAFIIMAIGWFVVMNIIVPKVMSDSVGIHPVVVLASILIGLKFYGVAGAIFAVPVAAIVSAFFFHFLNRSSGGPRDVASRAARRLEEREGRPVRVPTPPPLPPVSASDAPDPPRRSLFQRRRPPLADADSDDAAPAVD